MKIQRLFIAIAIICLAGLVIVEEAHLQSPGSIFVDVSRTAGINATHRASWNEFSQETDDFSDGYMAVGQAWGDYDNDGWLDLYVTGNLDDNVLYHNNQDGTFSVSKYSKQLRLPHTQSGGAVWADYDNDGLRDLYVVNHGQNALFRNSGELGFINVTQRAGVGDTGKGTAATWGDYDQDGFLDLYVVNWSCYPKCDPLDNHQARDRLYHNDGDGTFTDVSHLLDYDKTLGSGFSATFADYDGDGDMDLYVVNDILKNPIGNVFWRNDGPGCKGWCWIDASVETGTFFLKHGMGIAIGDYDNDLDQDVYFSDMVNPMVLLQNQGDGTFTDMAEVAGVEVGPSSAVGWGTGFFDYNNDGWLDLYLSTTEFIQETVQIGPEGMHFKYPNYFFENNGDGTFTDISPTKSVENSQPSMGFAYADYDNDGWVDYVLGNWNQGYALYRNMGQAGQGNHWLTVRAVGAYPINRDAIGAKVYVQTSDGRRQMQEVINGSSQGAGNDTALHFGLGRATVEQVTIVWPDGRTETFDDVPTDAIWQAVYFEPFEDVSRMAGIEAAHRGVWDMFNPEFESGYLGIGQSWSDYNRDGWVDLYVSGNLEDNVLYQNNRDGTFSISPLSDSVSLPGVKSGGTVWADYDNDGWPDLYVLAHGANVLFHNDRGRGFTDVTAQAGVGDGGKGSSATWGDYDKDGYLDLYVVNWACYPECEPLDPELARDRLYHNNGDGTFSDATDLLVHEKLLGAGFTASFVDFDDDGDSDIYVVNDALKNPIGNVLWRNDGPGCNGWCWADASTETGAGVLIEGMGLAVGDYDNDLDLDFYFSNMVNPMALLQNENGAFVDVADSAGVAVGPSSAVGWGTAFLDYNNDGWQDLYLATTGFVQPTLDEPPQGMHFSYTDYLFENDGAGAFVDVTPPTWSQEPTPGMGLAYADYDNDGWVDYVLGNWNQGYALYRNRGATTNADQNWLTIRLEGGGAINRDAVGARVYLKSSDGQVQMQEVKCGSSLGAGHDMALHFGLGQAGVEQVVVLWPDGTFEEYNQVPLNQVWKIEYLSVYQRFMPVAGLALLGVLLVGAVVGLGMRRVYLYRPDSDSPGSHPILDRFKSPFIAISFVVWSLFWLLKMIGAAVGLGGREMRSAGAAAAKPGLVTTAMRWLDARVGLVTILFLFWSLFWLLNGGDKFFNGQFVSNINPWSAKSVLVDAAGDVAYTLHPMETTGWYGVNRDQQMIHFFQKLNLPAEVALTALYGIALAEVFLGLLFLMLFGWSLKGETKRQTAGLLADRTLHRLALKGSIALFTFFTIGDLLFGDRTELWEHSTFIILGLVSYYIWFRMDREAVEEK